MRKHFTTTQGARCLAAFLGLLAVSGLEAQQPQRIQAVTFRKSAPGKAADFRKFAETSGKKFFQAGVDAGNLQGAMALRLTAPYVTGSPYDYAIVVFPTQRPTFAPANAAAQEAAARKAGFASLQAYADARDALSTAYKSEWMTSAVRMGSVQAGYYLRVIRYAVEREHREEAMRFLREVSMPLAAQRIKDGAIAGWAVNTPAMMSPDEAGYAMSVATIYPDADSASHPLPAMTEDWFKKAIPTGLTYPAYFNRLNAVNALVKAVTTRVYEVVAVAGQIPQLAPEGQ
jgi:hypothetical protein